MKGVFISDFTVDNFTGYLANDSSDPKVTPSVAPFGQVTQTIMDQGHAVWDTDHDFAMVWTLPDVVSQAFARALSFEKVEQALVLEEVDRFSEALLTLENRVGSIFVPTWVLPTYCRGWGMLDMKNDLGLYNLLSRMNLRLADNLNDRSSFYLLPSDRWVSNIEGAPSNPSLWYRAKIPFGHEVFKLAALDIKSALRGILGMARKIILVDLDDTLWGGIVGDLGWENIQLGGHDPEGEAFVDFQKALKSFINKGIILGIISKNEEDVALKAIKNHPEMILSAKDFAGWRINWNDKAQNIIDLIEELNLGLQSVVFIDDNPSERDRVREAIPEVFVPDWPENKLLYSSTLLSLDCFDIPSISKEDIDRSKMYSAERGRNELRRKIGSLEDWLKSLDLEVVVEELNEANLPRTTQLLNKTNQMNLTTRRMSENELLSWAQSEKHYLWTFNVTDRFGNAGLTGITSLEIEGEIGKVTDFILSCRVMGKKIEEIMVHTILDQAQELKLKEVYAKYLPTEKNKPCHDFWLHSGFNHDPETEIFAWFPEKDYPKPEFINLKKK